MTPKYNHRDWAWVRALDDDGTTLTDFRVEVLDSGYSSYYDDFVYVTKYVDFPDAPNESFKQSEMLPYFAKKYDGRYIFARENALKKQDPQYWYTNFNLHKIFVPRKMKQAYDFGDLLPLYGKKAYELEFDFSRAEYDVVDIEDGIATVRKVSWFSLLGSQKS